MASTQKLPGHDSHNSSTQESVRPSRDSPGRPGNPYSSGGNVHKGGAKPDPDGGAPASQPKKQTY